MKKIVIILDLDKMDKDLFDKAEYFMKINEEDFDKVTAKLEELEV